MTTEPRWGGDGLGPEDMAIPEIKLVQNVGGDLAKTAGANPGDFYCSLTDETIKGEEGFDLVIVAMQKNRTYWGRNDIADEPPVCASVNAGSMLSMNGEDCKICPYRNESPWLLSPAERRTKCLVNYNIVAIRTKDYFPILLRTSGISAQAAKELYTQLSLNKNLIRAWYKAKTHVTSMKKKTSAGDAYAIKFSKLELIEDKKQLEEFETQSSRLIGAQITLPEGIELEVAESPRITAPLVSKKHPVKPTQSVPAEHRESLPIDYNF